MRLFVAVDIDPETRAQLGEARDAMQAALLTSRVPPRVTWVKPENAHVTLRFIGEASEATAIRIGAALKQMTGATGFDVSWDRLGGFPNDRRPRVVWIGPRSADALADLAQQVNDVLTPIVGPGESRPFAPHLTLGRVKEPGAGVDWPRAYAARTWVATLTRVDHLTLYLSRLSSKGPTYTAVSRVAG